MVATGTNNGMGIAGIGYNTRVRGYHTNADSMWNRILQAYNDGIKIINISWNGIPRYDTATIRQMASDGVVFVLGADNDSLSYAHLAYADIPGVINVSGVNEDNRHRPTNTARNGWVDVCAVTFPLVVTKPSYSITYPLLGATVFPPECIQTATGWYCLDGTNTQGHTSLAAPQVAGVVALMRSVNSFLSAAQIETIIKTTSDPINDDSLFISHPPNQRPGRVNAYKAVKQAKEMACGTTDAFSKDIYKINESVNGGNINISNTTVRTGRRLSVSACNSVTINAPFLAEAGSVLNININPYP
jgi:subtilisin family serine protease